MDISTRHKRSFGKDVELTQDTNKTKAQLLEELVVLRARNVELEGAEAALSDSKELFFKFFQSSPAGLVITNLEDGKVMDVNRSFLASCGYSREESIGHTSNELGFWIGHDREIMIDKLKADGAFQDLELNFRHKSGETRTGMFSAELTDIKGVRCIVTTLSDVTERKRADEARRLNERRVRMLATRLQEVREEERTSLAHELHDRFGEILTAVKLDLDIMAQSVPAADAALSDPIRNAARLLGASLALLQDIYTRLRPPMLDVLGLKAAIEWYVSDFGLRRDLLCKLDLETHIPDVSPDCSTAVFRILQEALTNAGDHANASKIRVGLSKSEDNLVLEVADDGIGISESQLHAVESLGILGMSERADALGGGVDVHQGTEGDTVVTLRMPIAAEQSGTGYLRKKAT